MAMAIRMTASNGNNATNLISQLTALASIADTTNDAYNPNDTAKLSTSSIDNHAIRFCNLRFLNLTMVSKINKTTNTATAKYAHSGLVTDSPSVPSVVMP